jgi:hypothetical protein
MDKAPDNKILANSDIPFPFESEIGRRLVMGDICWYAPCMLNKIGKEGKTSWDSFSYALMMGHNVYCHIVAVQRAQQLMDIEIANTKGRLNWRHWRKAKSVDVSDEYSEWVPRNILYFSNFVEELFETKTKKEAFDLIYQARSFLQDLDGARMKKVPARNTFSSLFDIDNVTSSEELDLTNPEDTMLRSLEEKITEK